MDATFVRDRLGIAGELIHRISWAGVRFSAAVRPDWSEVNRRAAHGLGAVTSYTLLDAVTTLPIGLEVPWDEIDPVMAGFLDCAPPGVASCSSTGITRELRVPLRSIEIVKLSDSWRAAGRVGVLARDAATTLVVRHRPRDLSTAVSVASRCGLGLVHVDGDHVEELAEPTAMASPSLRRTRLLEVVYGALLRQTAGTPANRSQALSCLDGA